MPRPRKPWFRKATGWWMVEIDGRQLKLANGRERKAEAERKYHTLMAEIAANPPVDGGDREPLTACLLRSAESEPVFVAGTGEGAPIAMGA